MGTLTVTEFTSLDGVAQAPGGPEEDRDGGFAHGGWEMRFEEPQAGAVIVADAMRMDALLLGRRTYEIFAAYWPNASPGNPFTALMNGVPKYVASRTLHAPLTWAGSTLLGPSVADEVHALTARHEQVHVIGSLDLVQTLLQHGLVDRLNLWVYPLLLGDGKRVFAGGSAPTSLRLTDATTYPSGIIHAVYDATGAWPPRTNG